MNVKLNGKQTQTEAKTVLELLNTRQVEPQMVAVELNEKMLEREDFEKTPLHEGDRIELHYFMGGGGPFVGRSRASGAVVIIRTPLAEGGLPPSGRAAPGHPKLGENGEFGTGLDGGRDLPAGGRGQAGASPYKPTAG